MATLDQLRARFRELSLNLEMLSAVDGPLDEGQRKQWDEDFEEVNAVRAEIEDRVNRNKVWEGLRASTVGQAPEAVDTGTATRTDIYVASGDGARAASANKEFHVAHKLDDTEIFDRSGLSVDTDRDGNAWHTRAMHAIDSWDRSLPDSYRESAASLVANTVGSKRDRQIADHILTYGNPDYVRQFKKYLAHPDRLGYDSDMQRAFSEANERALNEGSTAAGGAIVPPFLDPAIILTNAGISNPFRTICTVKTIATQTWKGVTSAGVTAEWTSEAAEVTDASPTLVQPSITPIRADAYVQASFEMLEDTDIASELSMLFADARDRLEGTAFAVGTGSTQPEGIVTRLNVTTASKVASNTNAAFGAVDVFALDNNLPQRWRANATYVGNKTIFNLVRQMATGSGPQFAFWTDFGGGRPSQLIGYNVYEASAMQSSLSTATASVDNVLVLGDFREYYVVDRIGMSVAYNPMVLGANRRPTGEVGWICYWRVGGDTVNADAFRMLQV